MKGFKGTASGVAASNANQSAPDNRPKEPERHEGFVGNLYQLGVTGVFNGQVILRNVCNAPLALHTISRSGG